MESGFAGHCQTHFDNDNGNGLGLGIDPSSFGFGAVIPVVR